MGQFNTNMLVIKSVFCWCQSQSYCAFEVCVSSHRVRKAVFFGVGEMKLWSACEQEFNLNTMWESVLWGTSAFYTVHLYLSMRLTANCHRHKHVCFPCQSSVPLCCHSNGDSSWNCDTNKLPGLHLRFIDSYLQWLQLVFRVILASQFWHSFPLNRRLN